MAGLDLRVHDSGGGLSCLGFDDGRLMLIRHEYSVEPEDNLEDYLGHLWSQIGPWLEIPGSQFS